MTPNRGDFRVGEVNDIPLAIMVLVAGLAAIAVTVPRDHLRLILTLSCVGYSLAVIYAFIGAPDVALVAVVIETIFALLFLGMLVLMPRRILRYETNLSPEERRVRRDAVVAVGAGAMAFIVVWGALSRPTAATELIDQYRVLTPLAHGRDIVTVILADFRGFDTAAEITVITITMLGIVSLLRSGRLR